ncbi:MAG: hypothetical protein EZS28_003231 [Streblomastix strix]|uniref:Uncharacterized protein n=1 Tax=Streblomastix strix TaxID=222440 RepID=A0A5J4X417_9EUKA|nr:MAG: hypothetical protein EZS28_003231 [Streblomastix strix]
MTYEMRLKIVETHGIDADGGEIFKALKLSILTNAKLLSTLMIFDDIVLNSSWFGPMKILANIYNATTIYYQRTLAQSNYIISHMKHS